MTCRWPRSWPSRDLGTTSSRRWAGCAGRQLDDWVAGRAGQPGARRHAGCGCRRRCRQLDPGAGIQLLLNCMRCPQQPAPACTLCCCRCACWRAVTLPARCPALASRRRTSTCAAHAASSRCARRFEQQEQPHCSAHTTTLHLPPDLCVLASRCSSSTGIPAARTPSPAASAACAGGARAAL